MAQGLRKHRHCYYEVNFKYYYDNHRNCIVRNTYYECMICGHEYHEVSELSQGPPKERSKSSVLEKNKIRHRRFNCKMSSYFALDTALKGVENSSGRGSTDGIVRKTRRNSY